MQTIYGNINWHKIQYYKMTIPGIPNKAKNSYNSRTFPKLWKDNWGSIILGGTREEKHFTRQGIL